MGEDQDRVSRNDSDPADNERREFLRRSIYAAYATPLITALLVEKDAVAGTGPSPGTPEWCADKPNSNHPGCQ